jgi:FAD/FMN-containing dehydrogenase
VLTSLYPDQVLSIGASSAAAWREKFWARHQREATPALVFQPNSTEEVAVAVLLCRKTGLNFSVKSGGHAAMRGASSSDGGIVIDLEKFNQVEVNEDKGIARIGSGGRWTQVFTELGKHGLAVAGGRSGGVGVGGYTLGGMLLKILLRGRQRLTTIQGAFRSLHLLAAGPAVTCETTNS